MIKIPLMLLVFGGTTIASLGNILLVSSTANSGPGSLRDQIGAAASGDTIQFATAGIITLTNGEIIIAGKNLVIDGPGATNLTITTGGKSRALRIENAQTTIKGLAFSNCSSTGAVVEAGGAIEIDNFTTGGNSNTTSITDCTFINNRSGWGGAVDVFQGGLVMTGCAFISNRCTGVAFGTYGGGGAISLGVTMTSTIANCTFSGNSQGSVTSSLPGGGAVYNFGAVPSDPPPVTFNHCTFVANVDDAGQAGAIKGNYTASYHSRANLKNCLLINNLVPSGTPVNFGTGTTSSPLSAAFVSLGGNCTDEQTSSTNIMTAINDLVAASDLAGSVAPLADNGGPTRTHAITRNSPARGKAIASTVSVDQRGAPRDAVADSGAFERIDPLLSVSMAGTVASSGDVVAFGPTATNTPVTKTLIVSNAQSSSFVSGPLSISGFSVPAGYSSLGFAPALLANGQALSFTVTLNASVPGVWNGFLHITNSETPYTVQLAGLISDSLEHWRQSHFGPDANNSGNSADNAAPTGDGIPNLIKYALGLDPAVAYPANMNISTDLSPEGALRMTVTRNPVATDVDMYVEVTGDLKQESGWTKAETIVDENSATLLKAHDAAGGASSESRFIRLNATPQ